MKKQRKDALKTCCDLIESASIIFAEKGYKDATIAQICKNAHTNVASVNYHFGSKENLYAEAWRHSFRESLKRYPPDGGVSDNAPAKDRLRGRIMSLIKKLLDKDHRAFSIMQKELAQPTGLLTELVTKELKPIQDRMVSLVRELLGSNASEKDVQSCRNSIIGQCFHLSMLKRMMHCQGAADNGLSLDNIDELTDHIVRFSLAGIKAVRGRI